MPQSINISNAKKPSNHWQVLTLCWLFAILYGVWLLPHTVFVRNVCLVGGALLSLPIIAAHWRLLFQRAATPIWLIALLLIWVTIHLFFIGQDFNRQYLEYVTIWKRVAIGCVFALGLGLAIGQTINQKASRVYWTIIYFGLLLPTLVYFAKYGLGLIAPHFGLTLSPYVILNSDHMGNDYGISRARYVFFCLPAMAIGLGSILNALKQGTFHLKRLIVYLLSIPLTLVLFALEGDRLGAVYGLLLIGVFAFFATCYAIKINKYALTILVIISLMGLGASIVQKVTYKNLIWHSLWVDAKVAIQVDRYDGWRTRILPSNELGVEVNPSSYERISWATAGGRLLLHNPFGYGLLSLSFGGLGKQIWPNADISWTHSAWLDFALGYGFPGLVFIWLALSFACQGSRRQTSPWCRLGSWGLLIAAAVMFTKEISTEVVINAMIFMIVFTCGISMAATSCLASTKDQSIA